MYEVNQWQFSHNRIYYNIVGQLHVEKNSMQFSNLSKSSFLSLKQTFFSWLNPEKKKKNLIEHNYLISWPKQNFLTKIILLYISNII